jgi:glutaminase
MLGLMRTAPLSRGYRHDVDPIERVLGDVLDDARPLDGGETAQYIPELAAADPDPLALAVTGPRGRTFTSGDAGVEFTIQSISRPFVLALAFAELGRAAVLERVGVEPSGEPFNAISLEPGTGRPANPLVNAGAIATTALVPAPSADERTDAIVAGLSRFAGRPLEVDDAVYRSESGTGDRNRALAHLLRSHGIFTDPVDDVVEAYFRQCSVRVTVQDLSVMAGTLAFAGRNPVTGEQVVDEAVARDVVSIVSSCGMYDFSGEWLLRVGLPAKSGVSGGILAIAPSQFGVATFSPRLDAHGNSVRGQRVLERLSREFGMHVFDRHEGIARPGVTIDRTDAGTVVRFDGELAFSGAERALATVRELIRSLPDSERVVIDVSELALAHPAAVAVLRLEFDRLDRPVTLRD